MSCSSALLKLLGRFYGLDSEATVMKYLLTVAECWTLARQDGLPVRSPRSMLLIQSRMEHQGAARMVKSPQCPKLRSGIILLSFR